MKVLNFTKWAGSGNDFILVDNRSQALRKDLPKLAVSLCDRKRSIGGDGLILLERSAKADIRMRIFNPDGSEAEMCGNGVRCLAKWATDQRIAKPHHTIESVAGVLEAEVKGDRVRVKMTDPKDLKLNGALNLSGKRIEYGYVDTGVPHAVVLVPSLDSVDAFTTGRAIRQHAHFAPRGTNANFVSLKTGNAIEVRTYERGVEDVTLSSGTGSTASALIAAAKKGLKSPVEVHTKSGEVLKIYFTRENGSFREVFMEGPVKQSFEGRVTI